jgi:hypothetical protein
MVNDTATRMACMAAARTMCPCVNRLGGARAERGFIGDEGHAVLMTRVSG